MVENLAEKKQQVDGFFKKKWIKLRKKKRKNLQKLNLK